MKLYLLNRTESLSLTDLFLQTMIVPFHLLTFLTKFKFWQQWIKLS